MWQRDDSVRCTRNSFQVKTSNNESYRVTPVYGFVEKSSKAELTIIRLEGPPKEDKFVLQWAEVPDEETDAEAPFKAGAQAGESRFVIVTVLRELANTMVDQRNSSDAGKFGYYVR
ncbi:unnamed protein product [Toxocara canis]|uniref:MSP domain-containing protein n=1 Tax=Toxocara canis TaxID=6265 RepID=A0A183U540_TOXCA|nr:unnamed protein product [Toxocara canis]